ncbi:helix-turn-helix domain-containing protein [Winogradskyella immobilis]|uniref:AraC family transcriptional regulator n=1 Tax=Winogradskyella immobilis TaxID=2816852 RepID=A0ABS8EM14_9FLAO|nr:helix-turn-helix domain-containing protein [Winogradskyella immobilis]MCC1484052.1 AraC family transcriptional regulator [Winogradskyella immobilis]MCG0016144.1 helix-turn-helix domain-containing protein [Winogradskyella immobilis]
MKTFLDFSLTTGIIITSIILFVLLKQKNKSQAKKVLLSIFILIFLEFVFSYSYLNKIVVLILTTYILETSIVVLIGPLLFLYVKAITKNSKLIFKENLVHFIFPFIFICVISIPGFIDLVNKSYSFKYLQILDPIVSFSILYSLFYILYSLKILKRFSRLVKHSYSNLNNKDLKWIEYFLKGTILIISIDIITTSYELLLGELDWNIGYLTIIPIVFLIAYLGYYGISQTKVLLPNFLLTELNKGQTSEIKKKQIEYDKSEMNALEVALKKLMSDEKPYLTENLTLRYLAELLSTSDKKLSLLLNQHMNISFYDYINSYRVNEVKRMIDNNISETYTLLAIAYDCGFNSKTSFNRIFKKITGLSPSAYKKQLKPI